jgi:hypothetical protein
MASTHLTQLGLGSSFNLVASSSLETFELKPYITDYMLFYTGRHAIRYLIDAIQIEKRYATIWLPEYYCQHVTAWLKQVYSNIKTYPINPFDEKTTLDTSVFSSSSDIVILNNFWGVYNYSITEGTDRPIYIEDHSHGWLSKSCLESTADYCFASLRKTLPIALGGIAWKPKGKLPQLEQQSSEQPDFTVAWDRITRAMEMKTALLNGATQYTKPDYLNLVAKYEHFLHQQYTVVQMQETHQLIIEEFLLKDYRSYKKANLTAVTTTLAPSSIFKIIPCQNNFTFGLELVFTERSAFNELKSYLIQHHIYPSELWPDNIEDKFLLNIHIDFRYTKTDMKHIAATLNNWTTSKINQK